LINKQQSEKNTALSGHWFVIGAALLWGTTSTAQAFLGIGLIFSGLLVLMMKKRHKPYEVKE